MSKVKLIKPTPAEDAEIAAGIAADPDTMEMSAEQFAVAGKAKRSRGRPAGSVAESRKLTVSLRLDPDLVEAMRASGSGWQTRCNQLLRREFLRPSVFHSNNSIEGVAADAAAVTAAVHALAARRDAAAILASRPPRIEPPVAASDMDIDLVVVENEMLEVTRSVSATVDDMKRSFSEVIDDVLRRLSTSGHADEARALGGATSRVTESLQLTERQIREVEEAIESLKRMI